MPDYPTPVPPLIQNADEPDAPGTPRRGRGAGGKFINLVKLAEAQRQLLWCILARVFVEIAAIGLGNLNSPYAAGAYVLVWLILIVVTIVFIARMALAFGSHPVLAILGAIAVAIPCAGLIILLILNQRVTSTLQRVNVKVGLMGVSPAEMNKLRLGVCTTCGYDLRGLPSPVCPECGTDSLLHQPIP